jgi:hypothetical protein
MTSRGNLNNLFCLLRQIKSMVVVVDATSFAALLGGRLSARVCSNRRILLKSEGSNERSHPRYF